MIDAESSLDSLPKRIIIKKENDSTSLMLEPVSTNTDKQPCQATLTSRIPVPIHDEIEKHVHELMNTTMKDIGTMKQDLLSIKREFDDFKTKLNGLNTTQNDKIQDMKNELCKLTKIFTRVYGKKL